MTDRSRTNRIKHVALSLLMVGLLSIVLPMAGVGCKPTPVGDDAAVGSDRYYQKYELSEVRKRAKELKPGMSKGQVLIILGSPAIKAQSHWDYVDNRPGAIIPAMTLRIEFDEAGVYVKKRDVAVVFGGNVE